MYAFFQSAFRCSGVAPAVGAFSPPGTGGAVPSSVASKITSTAPQEMVAGAIVAADVNFSWAQFGAAGALARAAGAGAAPGPAVGVAAAPGFAGSVAADGAATGVTS